MGTLSSELTHVLVDAGGAPVLADPSWSEAGTMLVPRGYHAAALLPDGKILVTGGATSGATLGERPGSGAG